MKSIAIHVTFILCFCGTLVCAEERQLAKDGESTFKKRRQRYIDQTLNSSGGNAYTELVRLKMGIKPDEDRIRDDGLKKLKERRDTADFRLPAVLGILYSSDSGLLSESLIAEAKDTILNFKYWPDELEGWDWAKTPQMDSAYIYKLLHDDDETNNDAALAYQAQFDQVDAMDDMCYWSENHFILFSSGAYLAAQLYPSGIFTASGETGTQRMLKFKPRVMRWLELRYKSGFSEWLSNVYYNEDMPAVLALIELCEDQDIQQLATMVMDLMMADMALNSFQGSFSSTHGRTYENKMSGTSDHTRSAFNVAFGTGKADVGNMSASMLAISEKYQLPQVIYEIANDTGRAELINKQRMGITIDNDTFTNWGLDTRSVENGGDLENMMTFLTLEAYTHPLTIELFRDMLDAYSLWGNKFFEPFKESRLLIEHPELFDTVFDTSTGIKSLSKIASLAQKDITRNMRPEVNIYTYRTPDYMLSTAQDWRPGFGGDQQSIWQATLGMKAVCFTTHPAQQGDDSQSTPNYWTGYGTLPRAIQVKNVVMSLYDIDTTTDIYITDQPLYTHAYLPRGKFDKSFRKAVNNGAWFFARKDDAYLALFSSDKNADWIANDDDRKKGGKYEIIANGEKTVWICELAGSNDYANFDAFTKAITNAPLTIDLSPMKLKFQSPSQGNLIMDWENDLIQNGNPINAGNYKRYENPYSNANFPANIITFQSKGNSLILDFANKTRTVTNSSNSSISREN